MSYAAASELLSFDLEEEVDLSLLYKAALLRRRWRHANVMSIIIGVLYFNTFLQDSGHCTHNEQLSCVS
jgi:hypothetical protein